MKVNNPNYLNGLTVSAEQINAAVEGGGAGLTPEQTATLGKLDGITSSASEIDAVVGSATTNIKTYYVSNNGLDTNNGLTHLTPFKTIAKALTLISDYTTLKFECGSVFYEPLVYINSNLTFESYGVGNKPVIDGSSVIATPTLVSGNVYTTTNTYNTATTSSIRPMILENGVPMQPVGTQAECEALANSYVALVGDGVANGTYSIMFHTSDSVSPLTNGKVYRTNTRDALNPLNDSTSNCTARNLEVRYSVYPTNLPIIGGNGHKIESCNSRYGTKHNIYVSGNSIVTDCVAYGSELQGEYGKTATLFVAYKNTADGTETYTFDNCAAIMDLKKQGQTLGSSQIAFLAHCGTGKFKTGKLKNCYSRGCATSFGLSTTNVEVNNCYFEKMSSKCIANISDATSIKNSFFEVAYENNSTNEQGNVAYKNTTFINHKWGDCDTATMDLNNCLFYGGNSIKKQDWLMATSATSGALSLTMNNTIIFGYTYFTHGVVGTAYQGDYNVFYRTGGNQPMAWYGGVKYETLATWQTATEEDANSVYLTDAQSKTFFLTDPSTGVVTINPYAQVTGGNGTVYTGTFPDGTLLTDKFTNKNYSHLKSKYVDELDLLQYQN